MPINDTNAGVGAKHLSIYLGGKEYYNLLLCVKYGFSYQKALGAFTHNPEGSDGSAAGGGRSDLSEWQMSGTATGCGSSPASATRSSSRNEKRYDYLFALLGCGGLGVYRILLHLYFVDLYKKIVS